MYKMDSQKWVEFQVGGGGEIFLLYCAVAQKSRYTGFIRESLYSRTLDENL